jgi:hypothetical protein
MVFIAELIKEFSRVVGIRVGRKKGPYSPHPSILTGLLVSLPRAGVERKMQPLGAEGWGRVRGTHEVRAGGVEDDPGLSLQPPAHAGFSLADFSTLKLEAVLSS